MGSDNWSDDENRAVVASHFTMLSYELAGWKRTPFHISRNELEVAEERRDDWYLVRVYEFARAPKAFELRPPLDNHVALTATNFQASFQ